MTPAQQKFIQWKEKRAAVAGNWWGRLGGDSADTSLAADSRRGWGQTQVAPGSVPLPPAAPPPLPKPPMATPPLRPAPTMMGAIGASSGAQSRTDAAIAKQMAGG